MSLTNLDLLSVLVIDKLILMVFGMAEPNLINHHRLLGEDKLDVLLSFYV